MEPPVWAGIGLCIFGLCMNGLLAWIAARSRDTWFCWVLSIAMAGFYGVQSVLWATRTDNLVQDDVRQHVFWAFRFVDGGLFPGDWIADYYQSVAPIGYQAVYWLAAQGGIDPLWLSKLLPVALGLLTTGLAWRVMIRLLPVPGIALLGCALLNQALWLEDDLVSATPRAFATPLMLAIVLGMLERSPAWCFGAIILSGLLYPMVALLAAAALAVGLARRWWIARQGGPQPDRRDWALAIGGIGCAIGVLLPEVLSSNAFGPVISLAQAKALPEFNGVGQDYGRSFFFHPNPLIYWLFGPRSGFLFIGFLPPITIAALGLPWMLKRSSRFYLTKYLSAQLATLGDWLWGGLGLFLLAHATLFRLYLPNRYSYVPLRVVLPLAAALAIGLWLDRAYRHWQQDPLPDRSLIGRNDRNGRRSPFWVATLSILVLSIGVPMLPNLAVSTQLQMEGRMGDLYDFLQRQPKDTLTVSLSKEADFIPILARRSVLSSREFALPYHWGYYRVLRQRIEDTIRAQYSDNLTEVKAFLQKYGVDFWLLEPWSLTAEYLKDNVWLQQFQPLIQTIEASLKQGRSPILSSTIPPCSVLENKRLQLLDAKCILRL
jgi:hypothetical protein